MDDYTDEEATLLAEFGTSIVGWGESDVLPSRPVWEGNLPQAPRVKRQKQQDDQDEGDAVFLTGTSLEHQEEDTHGAEPGHRINDIIPPLMWDLTDIDTKMYQLRMTTTTTSTSQGDDDDELDALISGYIREADDELARNTRVTAEERSAIIAQAQRVVLGIDGEGDDAGDNEEDPFDDDPLTQEEKDVIEASAVQRIADHTADPTTATEWDDEANELLTLHERQQRAQDVYVSMARQVASETVDIGGELHKLDTANPTTTTSQHHRSGTSRAAWVTSLRPPQVGSFVDPELLACEARVEAVPLTVASNVTDAPSSQSRTHNPQHTAPTKHTVDSSVAVSRVTVATADKFFPSSECGIGVSQPSVLSSVDVPGHTIQPTTTTGSAAEVRRRKLQQRADWLSMQEVLEGVRMRQEDEKVIKSQRQRQAQLLIAKREQDAFFPYEGKERQEIVASEVLAFADIRERERRQRGVLEQFLRHKAMQHQAAKISDVVTSEGQIRTTYVDMEMGEWQEVQGKFDSHHKDITTRDTARATMLESALSGEDRMQLYEDEDDDRRHLFAKLCRGESEATLRLAERQAEEKQRALREVQEGRVQRVRGHIDAANVPNLCERLKQIDGASIEQTTYTKCSQMLQALKGRTIGTTQRPTSAPPTPRTTSPPPHPQHNSSNPFDAAALLRLYPFGSTPSSDGQQQPQPSTQILPPTALAAVTAFRSINGALEDFTGIDFDSLQRCSVGVSVGAMANSTTLDRRSSFSKLRGMTDANRQLPIAPLVEELNLGNNTFSQDDTDSSYVDLGRLLSVFPALQHVLLSGSGIHGIGGDALSPQPSKLTRLDVSNNSINRLPEHLSQLCPLLMQLTAFANHKMTESPQLLSSTWLHLAVVELSRTSTTDVSWMVPSGACLSSVDVTRTPLSDISPLLTNPVPFIQGIYASHCQLSSMPSSSSVHSSTGLFLRHLFIGGNTSLTHLGFVGQFPFLSVLKAESCQLQSIEGIKGCPLLETLDVSFNDLDTLHSLLPLGMCPSLRVLNINENPISKGTSSSAEVECTINGTTTTTTLQIKEFVLGMCQDSIVEYGNDLVDAASKKAAMDKWNSITSVVNNTNDESSSLPTTPSTYDPLRPSINVLKGLLETSRGELEERISPSWVRLLGQLNKEWTAVSLVLTRRYQRAVAAENGLQKRLRGRLSSTAAAPSSQSVSKTARMSRLTVGLYRDSNTAWIEMTWGRIALLSKHLTLMCAASRSPKVLEDLLAMGLAAATSTDASIDTMLAGMGCGSSPWDNLPLAITARGIVRQFLLGQVLLRRAKKELSHLKATSTMYGDAATKISATWRGHRVRRRLAAVRDDDDDDDAMYQKVAWSEPDAPQGGSVGVAGLMRTALTNHGTAQVFNQPIEMVAPPPRVGSAPGMLQGNPSNPLQPSHTLGANPTTRLGGNGAGFVSGVRGAVGISATSLDGEAERPSSVPTPPPPRDEWTSAMQAHLQNKQSKINKQQAANLRKEYLVDPLKAKQSSTQYRHEDPQTPFVVSVRTPRPKQAIQAGLLANASHPPQVPTTSTSSAEVTETTPLHNGSGTTNRSGTGGKSWVSSAKRRLRGASFKVTSLFRRVRGKRGASLGTTPQQYTQMVRRIIPTDLTVAAAFCDNVVTNSRYTLYSFIPLNLYEQFRRPLNVYFLFVAALQFISIIAPVNPLSTLLPLLFAFALTAAKEGYDDLKRHRSDYAYNHKRFDVLRSNSWVGIDSQDIRVGDIIRLHRNDEIPSDCVALAAPKESSGLVYIRTDNMDGEIDLKSRDVVPLQLAMASQQATSGDSAPVLVNHGQLFTLDAEPRDIQEAVRKFVFECPPPMPSLEAFDARVLYDPSRPSRCHANPNEPMPDSPLRATDTIVSGVAGAGGSVSDVLIQDKSSEASLSNSDGVSLSAAHLLPQSCFLKGVDEVIVLIVYTGNETKCGLSKKPQPIKWAKIDRDVSKYSKLIFICQLIMAFILGITGFIVSVTSKDKYWYIKTPDSVGTASSFFIYPLRFFLLTTVMIPISFKFVVDMSKYYMALVVGWDLSMWDDQLEMGAVVNNSSIVEDLGQIEYILSDKTGTMTRNEMILKLCSIDGTIVGVQQPEDVKLVVRQVLSKTSIDGRESAASAEETESGLTTLMRLQESLPKDVSRWFWTVMALCNTVEVSAEINADNTQSYVYAATSPDEEALCAAAALRGSTLIHRTRNEAKVSITTTSEDSSSSTRVEDYVLHQIFPFSSEKKCMSVIVENKATGKIHLIAKGADDKMLARLVGAAAGPPKAKAEDHLRAFAHSGLRTLIVCMKSLTREELTSFKGRYAAALLQLQDRASRLDALRDEIECNFDILLGATAIEDRLQEHVVQSISDFLDANIKVWMLTGDKIETANQIALSCALMESHDHVFRIYGDNWQQRMMSFNVPGKYIRTKNEADLALPSYVTIVQGGAVLEEILSTPTLLAHFTAVASNCKSVVCARVSPIQKAQVTAIVRGLGKLTLAIGDGGNDVAMIQEAHVGIGIVGKEGRQASRAADFAITKFHHLRTLLFIHGHQSYMRTAYVVQYSFYKSMLISFIQLVFNMTVTLMSGVSFWDSFGLTAWNGLYTLPQVVFYVFDRALPRIVLEESPFLYRLSQRGYGMTMHGFFGFILRGIIQSVALLLLTFAIFNDSYRSANGSTEGAYLNFTVAYTSLMFLQVFTVIVESHSITPPNAIAIFGMAAAYFLISSIYSEIPALQYYGVFHRTLDPISFAAVIFMSITLFVPRFLMVGIQKCFYPTAADALRAHEVQRQSDIGYAMGLSKKTHLTARNFVSQMLLGVEILLRTTITQEAQAEVIQHEEAAKRAAEEI